MILTINKIKIQGFTRSSGLKEVKLRFLFSLFMVGSSKHTGHGLSYKDAIVIAFALAGCGNYRDNPAELGQRIQDCVGEFNMNWKPIIRILKG